MTPEMVAYTHRHLAEVGAKIEAMLPILPDHWGPVEVGWLCAEIFDRESADHHRPSERRSQFHEDLGNAEYPEGF
jgi:hypothetical protein